MTVQPKPADFAIDAFLRQQDRKSLLRFVACGSVDHGKSTLIGRLLYESKLVLDDQLDALKSDSRKYGTQGKDLDFALLLDGLAAEREQKITIDVAYRFFSTDRRKFIVADTPGHEQYTRNMATGASTADLALILVNAEAGLTRQTKRHALIVSTLGVRHLVLAINKMDLVGWSQQAFDAIEADFRRFAADLNVSGIVCIPLSARDGDNVVARSQRMDWYRGPTLIEHLEQVEPAVQSRTRPFRMPVQLVNRPAADFRGYSGLITGGDAYVGMPVRIMPSERTSAIDRIVTFDGDVERASAGQSVTITLADEIDASRGDVLADAAAPPAVTDRLVATVVWMGKEPFAPGRRYLIKIATCSATATLEPALRVFDLDTRTAVAAERLFINDIGQCALQLDRAIAVDRYADSRETGSFILIDRESFDTVGMGFVDTTEAERAGPSGLRKWLRVFTRRSNDVSQRAGSESHFRSIAKAISWRTTGSIDTFIVTLVITGSAVFAGSVALTEILTKITLYYLHERVWSIVPWGRASVRTRA